MEKVDNRENYGEFKLLDYYFNVSVGKVLKEIRNSKGYSLSQAVKKAGNTFTRQTLSKYELGKSKIRYKAFFELAKAYEVEPTELYEKIILSCLKNTNNDFEEIKKELGI